MPTKPRYLVRSYTIYQLIASVFLLICSAPFTRAQDRTALQDSLHHLLRTQGADTGKVNSLNKLANSFFRNKIDSVRHYAQQAADLAKQLRYTKGQAKAESQLGIYERIKGNFNAALDLLLHSMHLYQGQRMVIEEADVMLNIAQVYKDMSDPSGQFDYIISKGLSYASASYDLFQSVRDTLGMIDCLNMSGILYRDIGKNSGKNRITCYDTAFDYYTRALALVDLCQKAQRYRGKLYNNISQVYNEYKKDYKKALEYLFKSVEINKTNNNLLSLTHNYGNISRAYTRLDQHDESLRYARKMLETCEQLKRPERTWNAYLILYESFQAMGKADSALRYYKLYDRLDDSLDNVAKTAEVMNLQTKYETGKKELQILGLQTKGEAQNKRIAFLALALVVVGALATWMIWLYHRIKKQQLQIAAQSQRLEIMMKELHHRVKNNLQIVSSLLSLQTYKVQDENAVLVLKESQQRVQAMSFIHQRLYKKESLTAVNMKEYLTDLAESLVSSYGYNRDEFNLQIRVEKEMMDIEQALPIGLIVNELMTNSLKYAYDSIQQPALYITLTEDVTQLTCTIKDNGAGIDEQEWKQKNTSFGKQLIKALCKQLRAQQSMVVQGGTEFTITIPKQAA